MPLTLTDLINQLRLLDEVTLIETLDLHSDEIVDRFMDLIEEHHDELANKVEDPRDEPNSEGVFSWEETSDEEALDSDNR